MKAPVTMNQAQVYGISKQNSEKMSALKRTILT